MLTQKELTIKPNTHLAWAVITTLFCCLPLGIVGILYASGVDDAWYRGDKELAYEKSRKAERWSNWAAIIGSAGIIIYVILVCIYGVAIFRMF